MNKNILQIMFKTGIPAHYIFTNLVLPSESKRGKGHDFYIQDGNPEYYYQFGNKEIVVQQN